MPSTLVVVPHRDVRVLATLTTSSLVHDAAAATRSFFHPVELPNLEPEPRHLASADVHGYSKV